MSLSVPKKNIAKVKKKANELALVFYVLKPFSHQFGLSPTSRIVEVDGIATLDLDAFARAVAGKRDGDSVRPLCVCVCVLFCF